MSDRRAFFHGNLSFVPDVSLRVCLAIAILGLAMPGYGHGTTYTALAAPLAPGITYRVNSTADEPDANTGDGTCAAADGACTLRAAIMQANAETITVTIKLPAGFYQLTRVGYDDNASAGDLDISAQQLFIRGAGSSKTVIDGNGALTGDRVFHILSSSVTTQLFGLTIQNGNVLNNLSPNPDGGGIRLEGLNTSQPYLYLNDVVIQENQANNGGGIRATLGDIVLVQSRLVANTGFSDGGGIYASGSGLTIENSQVFSNTSGLVGGGLYLSDLHNGFIDKGEVYSNTTNDQGGGLTSLVTSPNAAIQLEVRDSSFHNNHSSGNGGAIANLASMTILRTAIDANSSGLLGGGLYIHPLEAPSATVVQESTLSHNSAQYGGGISGDNFIPSKGSVTLKNTTLSDNSATHEGGGIYATEDAKFNLLNDTIADNRLFRPLIQIYPVHGGGVLITSTAIITAQNSLIGDNFFSNGVSASTPNDCFGPLRSLGNNLIEDLAHCNVSGTTTGNMSGLNPMLGPLQNNGGETLTRALLAGSSAIDAGANNGCQFIDQRGVTRPFDGNGDTNAVCDIGAYEFATHLSQTLDFNPVGDRKLTDGPFVIQGATSSGLPISFSSNTTNVCNVSGTSLFAGISSATVTLSFRGLCTLAAGQAGDATFDPAAPVTQTFSVTPGTFLPLITR